MKLIKTLLFFSLFIIFTSCEKEVEIDIPPHEPQLVVDGFIENDAFPIVILSTSNNIYNKTDFSTYFSSLINTADVSVRVDGTTYPLQLLCTSALPAEINEILAANLGIELSVLQEQEICLYTSFETALLGQIGKTYELNINYNNKSYSAQTSILEKPTLDQLFWKPAVGLSYFGYSYVTFSEPGTTQDAYMWQVRRIDIVNGMPIDAYFKKTFNPVFNDEFVNGKTFDFWYENPFAYEEYNIEEQNQSYFRKGDTVVVKFSKIDLPAYEFFEKKYAQISSGGSPFAAPSNVPSNVKGGALGVWVGYANYFDTLICQ